MTKLASAQQGANPTEPGGLRRADPSALASELPGAATGSSEADAYALVSTVDAARQRFRRSRSAGASRHPRVSVVIPTLNEALNLPHVLCDLPAGVHEVIIVDGLSTDGTPEVAVEVLPEAKVLHETRRGKGNALLSGFEAATGDILVMMDADGSADPQEIPAFVEALLHGADFAKGTRFRSGGGSSDITRLRLVGNRILSGTVNLLFKTQYTDLCYGYNAFWRHCLPAMSVDCAGFEVETLINIRIARAGLAVCEVPSYERDRIHGQSNLRTFRDGGRVLRTILRERLRGPQRAQRDDAQRHSQHDYAPRRSAHDDTAGDLLGTLVVEAGLQGSTSE